MVRNRATFSGVIISILVRYAHALNSRARILTEEFVAYVSLFVSNSAQPWTPQVRYTPVINRSVDEEPVVCCTEVGVHFERGRRESALQDAGSIRRISLKRTMAQGRIQDSPRIRTKRGHLTAIRPHHLK